ncbi:MAG: endonuclease/exonuclease/phosphatase family protein, partial [Pseudomonadota bacterium]|nr:endonuclease/exonuclease/phosphatase family protein [Pseudomonadota bacterium]
MRLVTWNVNGLRARAAHVDQVIEALQPDVLMLQEIKLDAAIFPVEAFAAAGLPHTCAHGF